MRLFGRWAARRLRAGPTLLVGDVSEERMLDAVRRFDPSARALEGKIRLRGVDLEGPIALSAELAEKASLPAGWPAAYIAVGFLPRSEPRALLLVKGLQHAVDGQSHAAGPAVPEEEWIDPVVSAFFGERLPEERVRDTVAPFVDGLTVERDPDGDYYLQGESPISLACTRVVYDPDLRPPRLDGLQAMECALFVEDKAPISAELLHLAGRIALALAEACGGTALDVHGFEVREPEDVHLTL